MAQLVYTVMKHFKIFVAMLGLLIFFGFVCKNMKYNQISLGSPGVDVVRLEVEQTNHKQSASIIKKSDKIKESSQKSNVKVSTARGCHKEVAKIKYWTVPQLPESLRNVTQEDATSARHICEQWLLPPNNKPRKLRQPERIHYSQRNQSEIVDELLGGKTDGFYLESGAFDGESLSNTLFFEKSRNWSGLLIEADPRSFRKLFKTNRRAHKLNACISPTCTPTLLPFRLGKTSGALENFMAKAWKSRLETYNEASVVQVQCFPLYSILQALGVAHIDFFSLDIDGPELDVLYTIPLDKIYIDVFSIEFLVQGSPEASEVRLKAITDYLVGKHGYRFITISLGKLDVILRKGP